MKADWKKKISYNIGFSKFLVVEVWIEMNLRLIKISTTILISSCALTEVWVEFLFILNASRMIFLILWLTSKCIVVFFDRFNTLSVFYGSFSFAIEMFLFVIIGDWYKTINILPSSNFLQFPFACCRFFWIY